MTLPITTVCALVAYDGSDFHGFQAQTGTATVQDVLETALDRFCQRQGRIIGAGRTDAGVHANGQVIRATVGWAHTPADLERAWNVHLPAAVMVRLVREAPPGFHPRFDAISRTYRYTVQWRQRQQGFPTPQKSPLTDRFALFETRPLDVAAMNEAATHLIGTHDFATFGQSPRGEVTERHVMEARWEWRKSTLPALDSFPGDALILTITANAFLRQMVRKLVGTLLTVGRGELAPEKLAELLAARDRSLAAPPVAPQGLVLERVTYPNTIDRWIHADMSD